MVCALLSESEQILGSDVLVGTILSAALTY